MDIRSELSASQPRELTEALISAYTEIETNFWLQKWKASELDSGHFVEAARRLVENRLFGSYTPIGKSLPQFSDAELRRYENASGDESYRILIPRALKAIFNVRNKRGVGHLGNISANEMDATFILYTVKWVLAELVRLESGATPEVVQAELSKIVERRLSVLWKHKDITRVLSGGIATREQVLVLLYDESPKSSARLQADTEYKNASNFRKILSRLHSQRVIEFDNERNCTITPKGLLEAEAVLKKTRV